MRQRVALVYTVFLGMPQNKHMVALKLPQRYVSMWYRLIKKGVLICGLKK